jgi:hypothetical protein
MVYIPDDDNLEDLHPRPTLPSRLASRLPDVCTT